MANIHLKSVVFANILKPITILKPTTVFKTGLEISKWVGNMVEVLQSWEIPIYDGSHYHGFPKPSLGSEPLTRTPNYYVATTAWLKQSLSVQLNGKSILSDMSQRTSDLLGTTPAKNTCNSRARYYFGTVNTHSHKSF